MELLVVITIIAILATMGLAAIFIIKDNSYTARCLSNQRQIVLALHGYALDWESVTPPLCAPSVTWNWTSSLRWYDVLVAQGQIETMVIGGSATTQGVLVCPANPQYKTGFSYGGNGQIGAPGGSELGVPFTTLGISQLRPLGNPLSIVQHPTACALTADAQNLGILTDTFATSFRHLRGKGGCYSFVDGHAKIVTAALYNTGAFFGVYTVMASDDAAIPEGRY